MNLIENIFSYVNIAFNILLCTFYSFIMKYIFELNNNNMLMFGLYTFLIIIFHYFVNIKIVITLITILLFIILYLEQTFEFYYLIKEINKKCKQITNYIESDKKLEKYTFIYNQDNSKIVYCLNNLFTFLKPLHDFMKKKINKIIFSEYMTTVTDSSFDKLFKNQSNNKILIDTQCSHKNKLNEDDIYKMMSSLTKTITNLETSLKEESFDDFLISDTDSEINENENKNNNNNKNNENNNNNNENENENNENNLIKKDSFDDSYPIY